MERLQKILAHGGIASRRAAEQLIKEGRVRVNGRVVTELGAKADARRDRVEVDGKRVVAEDSIYVVVNKPRGVVSTMRDPEGRPTVRELLSALPARVYPVGRLDFATSGVLLATNDGELADGLLHPRKAVPKTYVMKVKGVMKPDDIERWRKGVRLEDGITLPAEATLIRHEGDKTWLELTIKEGRNQQIRRMGEATGFPVMRLSRVSFAEISLEGLAPGRWRYLTRDELVALKKTYGVPRSIPSAASIPESPRARGAATPRYGGGSPGRRGYDVTEDWGGGAGRGSTRSDRGDHEEERPRGGLGGGRFGRTRTTGTSGGVGARENAGRVKGRPVGRGSKR
jgi:23S rRNA pseudouridine2605 synthase